jgi:peptidoglycan hydrolase-like protein with peptidoglycan-binding domain
MKTRLLSGRLHHPALALVLLVLASVPVPGRAGDQSVGTRYRATGLDCQHGVQYRINSEAIRLSLSDPIVAQVQLALRRRGYYAGPINGFLGQNTQIAIQKFQISQCCAVAPLINRWVLVGLRIGSEGKSAETARDLPNGQVPAID